MLTSHPSINPLHGDIQNFFDAFQRGIGAPVVLDSKDLLLRRIDRLIGIAIPVIYLLDDLSGFRDEIPERGFFPDNLSIVHRVGGSGHRVDHFTEVGGSPNRLVLAGLPQTLSQQSHVNLLSRVVHLEKMPIERPVGGVPEIFRDHS